jgi:hypothetical protein
LALTPYGDDERHPVGESAWQANYGHVPGYLAEHDAHRVRLQSAPEANPGEVHTVPPHCLKLLPLDL